jgi:hypothetical protein
MHGEGTYSYADGAGLRVGAQYVGTFEHNHKHGYGSYWYASTGQDVYVGQFVGDKKHGHGTRWYPAPPTAQFAAGVTSSADSRYPVYDGEYVSDVRAGKGTYWHADGRVDVSLYVAGEPTGEGAAWSADRQRAWRLHWHAHAPPEKTPIALDEAACIAHKIGLPVPPSKPALPEQVVAPLRLGLRSESNARRATPSSEFASAL